MQTVTDNGIQQQIVAIPQINNWGRGAKSNVAKTPLRLNQALLPEDIVTLSKDRSTALSLKKEPSSPVTTAEIKALREVFSVYA